MLPRPRMLVLITCAALMVARVALASTAELTRTIPITDTINQDVQQHRSAMSAELKESGCEQESLMGFVSPSKPSELVLIMTCQRWGASVNYTPVDK